MTNQNKIQNDITGRCARPKIPDPALLDQSHRFKLELACKPPPLHDPVWPKIKTAGKTRSYPIPA
jgi:hypothetical protein